MTKDKLELIMRLDSRSTQSTTPIPKAIENDQVGQLRRIAAGKDQPHVLYHLIRRVINAQDHPFVAKAEVR